MIIRLVAEPSKAVCALTESPDRHKENVHVAVILNDDEQEYICVLPVLVGKAENATYRCYKEYFIRDFLFIICLMYLFACDYSQANLENVREFKVALDQDRTAGMANFTEALIRAFNILERVSGTRTEFSFVLMRHNSLPVVAFIYRAVISSSNACGFTHLNVLRKL